MKQIITSIVVTVVLIYVLFNTNDSLTKVIVIPFLVFAIGLGLKNIFILLNKRALAAKVRKIYSAAFLVYLFGFLIYWDYISFTDGKYLQILFSIPVWIGGFYLVYKRLIKKA